MKTVEQRSPVQYSPRRQSMWVLADYGGKDLWNRWVWNSECVMESESGEQVGGELESVTSSAGCFMQGWRNETGSWLPESMVYPVFVCLSVCLSVSNFT